MATEAVEAEVEQAPPSDAPPDSQESQAKPDDGGDKGSDKGAEPTWRDDWRQQIAGEDEKDLKRLERFRSPQDVYRSFKALDSKLNSGEYRKVTDLPEKPTDEQLAEYRKENGIPEKWEDYYENFGDGMVIGEEDKPIVDDFVKMVHEKNYPPAMAADMLKWYFSEVDARKEAVAEEDKRFTSEHETELRAEWGGEYKVNKNAITAFLDTAPGDVKDLLEGARLGDGSPFLANADANRWLLNMAQTANPMGVIVPGVTGDISKVSDQIGEIENIMRTDRKRYDKDPAMQEKYARLLQARERMS